MGKAKPFCKMAKSFNVQSNFAKVASQSGSWLQVLMSICCSFWLSSCISLKICHAFLSWYVFSLYQSAAIALKTSIISTNTLRIVWLKNLLFAWLKTSKKQGMLIKIKVEAESKKANKRKVKPIKCAVIVNFWGSLFKSVTPPATAKTPATTSKLSLVKSGISRSMENKKISKTPLQSCWDFQILNLILTKEIPKRTIRKLLYQSISAKLYRFLTNWLIKMCVWKTKAFGLSARNLPERLSNISTSLLVWKWIWRKENTKENSKICPTKSSRKKWLYKNWRDSNTI